MEQKIYLNSNEKLAREVTGLESEAKHFVMNGESADKTLKREAQMRVNDRVEEYTQKLEEHANKIKEYADSLSERINSLEIKAIYNYALVKPYAENPFQKMKISSSGIIVDAGMLAPSVKSNETGEFVEEENFIHVGEVVDAGPKCEYIKDGDVIFWTKTSEVPVPFFKQGLVLVNENRVIAVVNEGLTDRFSNK